MAKEQMLIVRDTHGTMFGTLDCRCINILKLFTRQEVMHISKNIVRTFNYDFSNCDVKFIRESDSHNIIGSIEVGHNSNKVIMIIAFRGAQGPKENLSCVKEGKEEVHLGHLSAFEAIKDSLRSHINSFLDSVEHDMNYEIHIGGHSRGSAIVPQVVEELIGGNMGIPKENIKAVTFSPLNVYNKIRAEEYNNKFGNERHINFLIEEDSIQYFLDYSQSLYNLSNHYWQPRNNHIVVGNTITYSIKDNRDFISFVKDNSFIHLDPIAAPMFKVLSLAQKAASLFWELGNPIEVIWGSHMPEAYNLTISLALPDDEMSELGQNFEIDSTTA